MLGLDKKSLLFPKLVFLRDGTLEKESFAKFASNPPLTDKESLKLGKQMTKPERIPVRLYKLDFTKMEEIKQQRQWDRIKMLQDNGDIPNVPTPALKSIPESYAATMNALVFAIPDNYMKAINHCALMAQTEWEHPYPFDTIIREGCYEPAAAFVKVAFHLLADCIYDEGKRYYNRDWQVKTVFEQSALVRYWMHQVGSWVALSNAGLKISNGNGHKVVNTFYSILTVNTGVPDPVEVMMMDMLDFFEHIEAATPRPTLPAYPALYKAKVAKDGLNIRQTRKK